MSKNDDKDKSLDDLVSVLSFDGDEHIIFTELKPIIGATEAVYMTNNTSQSSNGYYIFTGTVCIEDHISALISWHKDARSNK